MFKLILLRCKKPSFPIGNKNLAEWLCYFSSKCIAKLAIVSACICSYSTTTMRNTVSIADKLFSG